MVRTALTVFGHPNHRHGNRRVVEYGVIAAKIECDKCRRSALMPIGHDQQQVNRRGSGRAELDRDLVFRGLAAKVAGIVAIDGRCDMIGGVRGLAVHVMLEERLEFGSPFGEPIGLRDHRRSVEHDQRIR